MVCGTGGERIARHYALRDAIHDAAASAGLTPRKGEGRPLLPGTNRRPADIFIPRWSGGKDGALDVMVLVIHPLIEDTRAQAATEPGYALNLSNNNKIMGAVDQCDQQVIAFIPVVAESLGGRHKVGLKQLRVRKRGRHSSHLLTKAGSSSSRRSWPR